MDFAVSQLPGWHTTIFPPYFVAGAIFSGLRDGDDADGDLPQGLRPRAHHHAAALRLHGEDHAGHRARWSATPTRMEFFIAWYSGNPYELFAFINRAFGPYAWAYWTMVTLQRARRRSSSGSRRRAPASRSCSWCRSSINIGMWFERFVIIVTSLHRDFLPSSWGYFRPTIWDVACLLGSFGLFFTMFCLFVRFLPMVATAEVKTVLPQADPHRTRRDRAGGASPERVDGSALIGLPFVNRLPERASATACSPSSRPRPMLYRACEGVRDAGYTSWDAHTPVPGARPRTRDGPQALAPAVDRARLALRRRRGRLRACRSGSTPVAYPLGDQRQAVLQLAGLRPGHVRARRCSAARSARSSACSALNQLPDAPPPALRVERLRARDATTASSSRSSRGTRSSTRRATRGAAASAPARPASSWLAGVRRTSDAAPRAADARRARPRIPAGPLLDSPARDRRAAWPSLGGVLVCASSGGRAASSSASPGSSPSSSS